MTAAPARDVVRSAVQSVIERTTGLRDHPELKRRLANRMEQVSMTAANLIAQDHNLSTDIAKRARRRAPLAGAQAAGVQRGSATQAVAPTLQATRQAIDFPGFVTSLISGVFQAMTTSSIQQLEAYAELLDAVGTSADDFAERHITDERASSWLEQHFAALSRGEDGSLTVREDHEMPDAARLRQTLGATDEEVSSVDTDDLQGSLVPLAKRRLGRDRQAMLATMVLMGMNRIVVDEGRIHASMELAVQARSTAEQQTSERSDVRVSTSASGSFGVGAWGASASISATVGYVRSDEQWSREDLAVRAGLRSSVDVGFHTEAVQLGRLANARTQQHLREHSMVPETEAAWHQESLLGADQRSTQRPTFDPVPGAPDAGPDAERARAAREAAAQREREAEERKHGAGGSQAGNPRQGAGATQGEHASQGASPPPPAEGGGGATP